MKSQSKINKYILHIFSGDHEGGGECNEKDKSAELNCWNAGDS